MKYVQNTKIDPPRTLVIFGYFEVYVSWVSFIFIFLQEQLLQWTFIETFNFSTILSQAKA